MKFVSLLTFIGALYTANSFVYGDKNNDRYFYFSGDDEETLQLIDAAEPIDELFIQQYTQDQNNTGYWLFTRSNPNTPQILRFGDNSSVLRSNFNKQKNTIFLVHGWQSDGGSAMSVLLTEAFLQDHEVNVIVMDWSEMAARNYLTAKKGVPVVGRGLGQFINWLVSLGTTFRKIHLVGFSLGGHLVGCAGRETGGKVQRITALDPAGPLWLIDKERITKTDGQYVEVIHTNIALLGYTEPCGDADFYPNGGASMTGCVSFSCSHSRSYEYMAASIKFNHFLATECGSLWNARQDKCSGDRELMGNSDLSPKRPGIYRVNTNRSYPY